MANSSDWFFLYTHQCALFEPTKSGGTNPTAGTLSGGYRLGSVRTLDPSRSIVVSPAATAVDIRIPVGSNPDPCSGAAVIGLSAAAGTTVRVYDGTTVLDEHTLSSNVLNTSLYFDFAERTNSAGYWRLYLLGLTGTATIGVFTVGRAIKFEYPLSPGTNVGAGNSGRSVVGQTGTELGPYSAGGGRVSKTFHRVPIADAEKVAKYHALGYVPRTSDHTLIDGLGSAGGRIPSVLATDIDNDTRQVWYGHASFRSTPMAGPTFTECRVDMQSIDFGVMA